MAVHFPIALLLIGAFFKLLAEITKRPNLNEISLWLLRVGCLAAVITAGLGLLAERTVPHVPPAWETLSDHKQLGLWLAGTSVMLWVIQERASRSPHPALTWTARLLWMAVVALVIAAGLEGGNLVYKFGVGVTTAPHL